MSTESNKSSVTVERVGTAEDAAREWEKAAFKQARRAETFKAKLVAMRAEIDALIAADEELDD